MFGINSIRKRLGATIIALSVCPLVLLGIFLLWKDFNVQQQAAIDLQEKMTKVASYEISSNIHELEVILLSLIKNTNLMKMERNQQYSSLSKTLFFEGDKFHHNIFNSIALLDNKGRELVHISRVSVITDAELAERSSEKEFIMPFNNGRIYYSPVLINEQTGEPKMKISIPLIDLQNMYVKGVLVSEINLKFMFEILSNIEIGRSGIAYMLNEEGRVLLHPNHSLVLKGTYAKAPKKTEIGTGLLGVKSLISAENLMFGSQMLKIVTELPVSEAEKYVFQTLLAIFVFLVITLIGSALMGFVLVRQIVQPIETLSGIAKSFSKGDFTGKVPISRKDELGYLSNVFNDMTSRLLETINSLEKEIGDRIMAEGKILQQNELLNSIINSLTHPFYVINANTYTIEMANTAAHFGDLTEDSKCYNLTHHNKKPCEGDEHPCTIREVMKNKKPVILEHVHYNTVENPRYYSVYGYPIFDVNGNITNVIEYSIDITDKKKLEKQFLQAQKMEAVGQLAGGIAHDFNNLLSAIIGYSEIVLTDIPNDHPAWKKINIIKDAGEKAAILTRQLLAFSRKQILEIKVINLNSIVEGMTKILNRVIGEDIHLEINTKPSLWNVKADSGQIEQVLMNLSVNARDAMPSGGRLIIETENIELDKEYAKTHDEVTPGTYVMLAVTDTGIGMSREIQEKIFEPFFTTKGEKGTGLGLSTIYGIIKQHGGSIFVYSELNVGSTFKIYLPSTREETTEDASVDREHFLQGTEKILVVDDEPSIRSLIADTLQPLGYKILEASCGKEALEISDTEDGEIDILLTDLVMPDMNGMKVAEIICKSRPSIKVIFMSGYTDSAFFNHEMPNEKKMFLPKPVTPTKLMIKIHSALK